MEMGSDVFCVGRLAVLLSFIFRNVNALPLKVLYLKIKVFATALVPVKGPYSSANSPGCGESGDEWLSTCLFTVITFGL